MYNFFSTSTYKKFNGIVYSNNIDIHSVNESSLPEGYHDTYVDIEDDSFWFTHRKKCLSKIINTYIKNTETILDLGGGNGQITKELINNDYNAILLEPSYEACKNAKKKGIDKVICGFLTDTDYLDNSIDNICFFDVLEHIENDIDFLKLIKKKLKSNGNMIFTVPAFNMLWSNEDEFLGHKRRYTIKKIKKLLNELDFEMVFSNYMFAFLFFPVFFVKSIFNRIFIKKENISYDLIRSQHFAKNNLVKYVVEKLSNVEEKNILKRKLLFGSSLVVIAKKR